MELETLDMHLEKTIHAEDVLADVALLILQKAEKRHIAGGVEELEAIADMLEKLAEAAHNYVENINSDVRSVYPIYSHGYLEDSLSDEEIEQEIRLQKDYYNKANKLYDFIDTVFRNRDIF